MLAILVGALYFAIILLRLDMDHSTNSRYAVRFELRDNSVL